MKYFVGVIIATAGLTMASGHVSANADVINFGQCMNLVDPEFKSLLAPGQTLTGPLVINDNNVNRPMGGGMGCQN